MSSIADSNGTYGIQASNLIRGNTIGYNAVTGLIMPVGAHADSNLIFRNKNGGIFAGASDTIKRNLIYRNSGAGILYVKNGSVVQNNTLVFNDSGMTNLTLASGQTFDIRNNIIAFSNKLGMHTTTGGTITSGIAWNDVYPDAWSGFTSNAVDVTDNIVATKKYGDSSYSGRNVGMSQTLVGIDPGANIFRSPGFIDTAGNNYSLNPSSLMINAGDTSLPKDPDLTQADIGMYYYFDSTKAPTLPPAPNSPANNSLGVKIPVSLSWTNTSTGTIPKFNLQVARDSGYASKLINDSTLTGTSYQLTSLGNDSVYYWRVRAFNSKGTSPFDSLNYNFRTILASPGQLQPAANAQGVTIPGVFSWTNVSGQNVKYVCQIAWDTLFRTGLGVIVNDTTSLDSVVVPNLPSDSLLYWRVYAINNFGSSSYPTYYTPFRSFRTQLGKPTLNAPTLTDTSETFSWSPVYGAVQYLFELDNDSLFAPPLQYSNTYTGTSFTMNNLVYGTFYYWRITAQIVAGSGTKSSVGSFLTNIPRPSLVSPLSNATGVSPTAQLTWAGIPGASYYVAQVSPDTNFITGKLLARDSVTTPTDTLKAKDSLQSTTKYYWKVMAGNKNTVSSFSQYRAFTTWSATSPTLTSPLNNTINLRVDTIDTFIWTADPGQVRKYQFTISRDSAAVPANVAFMDSSISVNTFVYSLPANTLKNDSVDHWQVRAIDSSYVRRQPSPIYKFKTELALPVLATPANNALNIMMPASFSWNAVIGATSYLLQVSDSTSRNASNVPLVATDTVSTNSYVSVPSDSLHADTIAYWRVKAISANGVSRYSSLYSFRTMIAPPTLIYPRKDSSGYLVTPKLVWGAVKGAAQYEVQVFKSSTNFSNKFVDTTQTSSNTSYTITQNLVNNTAYFWRVIAINNNVGHATQDTSQFSDFTNSYQEYGSTEGFENVADSLTPPTGWSETGSGNLTKVWHFGHPQKGPVSGYSGSNVAATMLAANYPPNGEGILITPSFTVAQGDTFSFRQYYSLAGSDFAKIQAVDAGLTDTTLLATFTSTNSSWTTASYPLTNYVNRTIQIIFHLYSVQGGTVGWLIDSVVFHNSTIVKPSAPSIVYPIAGNSGISLRPRITWNSSTGSYSSYQLQLSLDSLFKSFVINNSSITDTSFQIASPLVNDTVYYLRLCALNAINSSNFSPVLSFRTALSAPTLALPVNGTTGLSRTPQVSWTPVPKANLYIFQLSLQPTFGITIKTDTVKNIVLNQAGNVQFTVDTPDK